MEKWESQVANIVKEDFIPFKADGPLWWRVKIAVSLLLTPLTVILMGRSIRVDAVVPKEEKWT